MGLFGKKREKVIDFSERYGMSNKKLVTSRTSTAKHRNSSSNSSDSYADLGFVGDIANRNSNVSTSDNISWDNEPSSSSSSETVGDFAQKKQKMAKRLMNMTDKLEDLSNQIYHLKQRIELLEKKARVSYD
jgi:hypothetical protein